MSRFWLLTGVLTFGLASGAAAQAPATVAAVTVSAGPATALPAAPAEREINQMAKPVGDGLSLYTEPNASSKPIRISAWRQIKVRTIVDSTWCRALYLGGQFYAKRADIQLIAPGTPAPAK